MADTHHLPTPISGGQGLLDSEFGFLDRKQAAARAVACGQINVLRWPPDLYSEDLW